MKHTIMRGKIRLSKRNIPLWPRDPQLLVGSLIRDAVPIRDPANKWHAPTYMFSDSVYPDYLSGMKLGQNTKNSKVFC